MKLRELQRVRTLYEASSGAASTDSPSLKDVGERNARKKPPPREMTSATRAIVTAATEYLAGRTEVVPLRTVYHHIANERGIPIGGKNPINSLSAIFSDMGSKLGDGLGGSCGRSMTRQSRTQHPSKGRKPACSASRDRTDQQRYTRRQPHNELRLRVLFSLNPGNEPEGGGG